MLFDADLDDPLVDLELGDVLDFLRVFAVLARPQQISNTSTKGANTGIGTNNHNIPDLFS